MSTLKPPADFAELQSRLTEVLPRLPKRLRQCADYAAANSQRIAFATVAEFAAEAGVRPSAVVRFCQEIGFSGFSSFQELFRQRSAGHWPDYRTRLAALHAEGRDSPATLLGAMTEAGGVSLRQLALQAEPDLLAKAVGQLAAARIIHVAGFRRAFPVAAYLAYMFEKLEMPVILHQGTGGLGAASAVQPDDAFLAVTFAPYTQMTIDMAAGAKLRGATIIGITDSMASPLHQMGATTLIAPETQVGDFRPLTSAMTLCLSLAVAAGAARTDRLAQKQNN
jgi:DNA-binding MurR/RpiR family transcriptional regulator